MTRAPSLLSGSCDCWEQCDLVIREGKLSLRRRRRGCCRSLSDQRTGTGCTRCCTAADKDNFSLAEALRCSWVPWERRTHEQSTMHLLDRFFDSQSTPQHCIRLILLSRRFSSVACCVVASIGSCNASISSPEVLRESQHLACMYVRPAVSSESRPFRGSETMYTIWTSARR